MWAYVLRRLLLAVPTIFGVTIVVFLIMRIAPGDVAIMMLGGGEGGGGIDPEALARIRADLGLDRPLYEQYFTWIYGIFTLDFGKSFFYNADMDRLIARKAPLSLQVGAMGLVIGSILGITGGVIAALKQGHVLGLPDSWLGHSRHLRSDVLERNDADPDLRAHV